MTLFVVNHLQRATTMERLSKRDIKADQVFEKTLKEHVVKKKRRTLCISIRGGQAVLSGDDESVIFAQDNMENMTIEELMEAMKNMENEDNEYNTTQKITFPPMFVKYKGRRWTLEKARDQLQIYLNILGFGKGGSRKYRVEADEPGGWPDEHSFVDFLHPSYAKMDTIDSIIESLLQFHGYDANNHPSLEDDLEDEEPSVSNKRRKVQPRQNMNNIELEVNDNEPVISDEGQELDHGEEEEIGAAEHQPEISAYERMRDKNIAERKKKMKELGMLPHSQE